MFALASLGCALIVLTDIIPVYKDGTRREFWVSTSLLAVSLAVAALFSLRVDLLSPAGPLRQPITKIHGLQRENDI